MYLVYVYAPQPVLSFEEALVPPNANFHNPIICKPTNHLANHDCNLGLTVSSAIHFGTGSDPDHRSGIRASNNIRVVPEPNRRRRAKEHDIGYL